MGVGERPDISESYFEPQQQEPDPADVGRSDAPADGLVDRSARVEGGA